MIDTGSSVRALKFESPDGLVLRGQLAIPFGAKALVLFAHGSGSNRHSPRNRFIASQLEAAGYATALVDLAPPQMPEPPLALLADHLLAATRWAEGDADTRGLPIVYFGASTGAAVALIAAGERPGKVAAIVARGGRPDLVSNALLARVEAPALFLVGSLDGDVLALNRRACRALRGEREVRVIPGASHLFEEPGALEQVAVWTIDFLNRHVKEGERAPPSMRVAEADCELEPREDAVGSYEANGGGSPFKDREDAGVKLARALSKYRGSDALVLGVPRGGVPVAYQVAKVLGLPLDVMVARKLGAPGQEELAIGAVTPDGTRYLNDDIVRALHVSDGYLARVTAEQSAEARRRERLFRPGRQPLELEGRTVILIDDGLATGATMHALVRALRRARVARLVVAVPVGAPATCRELEAEVDELVCLEQPPAFFAVGAHYARFAQTSDEEVERLLNGARKRERRAEVRSKEEPTQAADAARR